jgi:hypothetical protein
MIPAASMKSDAAGYKRPTHGLAINRDGFDFKMNEISQRCRGAYDIMWLLG